MDNEKKLDEIVEKYNEECRFYEDYYLHNEDNIYADFTEWGWADADLDVPTITREIDNEETIELIEELEDRIGLRETLELIMTHSHKECVNIYIQYNEVYSVSMGEVEECPSDDLQDEFDKLSQDDKEYVRKNVSEGYISESGLIYLGLDFHRWVLILDTHEFNYKAKEVLEAA